MAHHFTYEGVKIEGLTAIGRVTVDVLKMNRPIMLEIRQEEMHFGPIPARLKTNPRRCLTRLRLF